MGVLFPGQDATVGRPGEVPGGVLAGTVGEMFNATPTVGEDTSKEALGSVVRSSLFLCNPISKGTEVPFQ